MDNESKCRTPHGTLTNASGHLDIKNDVRIARQSARKGAKVKRRRAIATVILGILLGLTSLILPACRHKAAKDSESREEFRCVDYEVSEYILDEDLPPCVEEGVFETIRAIYQRIDYSAEPESVERQIYRDYQKKFRELIRNEKPFWNRETGKEIYVGDWKDDFGYVRIHVEEASYYLVDASGDGLPQLCVQGRHAPGTVVFQYHPDTDTFSLWMDSQNGAGEEKELTGIRKAMNHPDYASEVCEFFQLSADGETESSAFFFEEYMPGKEEGVYMVMLPAFADPAKEAPVTKEMKQQGIYEIPRGRWWFRITKEQFEELAEPYLAAYEAAQEWQRRERLSYGEFIEPNAP